MRLTRWQVLLARLLFLTYVLFTASYCLLCYIPFTYQQVHVGELLPWVTRLSHWHSILFWPVLVAALLTILPDLKGGSSRYLALGFAGSAVLVGAALLIHPLLPNLRNDFSSLGWCLLSLMPLLWLAAVDWAHGAKTIPWPEAADADSSKTFLTCLETAVYLTGIYFGIVVFRVWSSQTFQFSWRQRPLVLLWSVLLHLLFFLLVFVTLDLVSAAAVLLPDRWQSKATTLGSTLIVALQIALALRYIIFPPLSFGGFPAAVVAAVLSVSLVSFASGISVRLWDSQRNSNDGGLDLLLAPFRVLRSIAWSGQGLFLTALALLAWILSVRTSRLDWEFLVQKMAVMVVWTIAFATLYTITPKVKRVGRVVAYGAGAVVLGCYLALASALPKKALETGSATVMGRVLEQYSGYDISFRFVDEMLRPEGGVQANGSTDSFYAFLAENTHIPRSIHLAPVDISLVSQLTPSLGRRPHIFFFVIDSLRRDYLAPYNAAVKFTPALNALAHDSVVFQNAFTHYGGTGLSEPSIWVGGLMLHQQYMTPFGPMNALQKLVDVDRYHEWISNDNVLHQVVPASPNITELDEHVGAMSYDLCSTLQELTERLSSVSGTDNPIFVYTQAQNIHVSVIDREGRSVPDGASFPPEFDAAYASRVQKIDACLGGFLDTLKKNGMYDNSVIVVTSDHGDSLGELGRWGHAYTIFPEIVRIPLLVHLPTWLRTGVKDDPDAVTFLTDLTPSLYYLLGERPVVNNPLFGRPLFTVTLREQRPYLRDSYLLASSYAPVYGLLTRNGRFLYIADGVNFRDYAYELNSDGTSREVPVADGQRADAENQIREQVIAIATFYKLH